MSNSSDEQEMEDLSDEQEMVDSSDEQEMEDAIGDDDTGRKDLEDISFEELGKLKERVGVKKYNSLMLRMKTKHKNDMYKRENKNRPRECSSKVPVRDFAIKNKIIQHSDPRFDSLCGTYNPKSFKKAYKFLEEIKQEEKIKLQKMIKKRSKLINVEKTKDLLQRMENQEREEKRLKTLKEKLIAENEKKKMLLKEGKLPYFKKKSEKKLNNLVDKFEELKTKGALKKNFKKRNKKNSRLPRCN